MTPKRIIFAGTPEFAVPSLQTLLQSKHTVIAVYTQPDRKAGRGQKLQASPVKQLALANHIPIYQPLTLKDAQQQAQLQALQADLMIVAAYGLLLPKAVLDTPRLGCINVHASLLPRWRGAAPIQRALIAGDATTGITLMQMDVGLDTGDILKMAECPILPEDTGQTLHDKLAILGGQLLAEHLDNIEHLPKQPQNSAHAVYAKKLDKEEANLHWEEPAESLARKIRAFNPWPIAQAHLFDQTLRIWEAQALPAPPVTPQIGEILHCQANGLDIGTSQGILRILKIQKAGGKIISIKDFLNAHPQYKQ